MQQGEQKINKKIVTFSCIFLLFLFSSVCAAEGLYVSGNVGLSWLSDATISEGSLFKTEAGFDNDLFYTAAIGYDFKMLRVEGEFGYRSHDIDKWQDFKINDVSIGDFSGNGDITAKSILINGFVDIRTNSPIIPYIGGGIGFADLELNGSGLPGISIDNIDNDKVFAYQLGAGVGYAVIKPVTVDLGYRFFATANPNFEGVDAEYQSHNVSLGVRITF